MNYGNYYVPQYSAQQPQQQDGILWVQGIAGAKAYPVAAGNSVLLMDSEVDVFYIKTTDQSRMPLPLRIFDYKERDPQPKNDTVTREEFNELKAMLEKLTNGGKEDAE